MTKQRTKPQANPTISKAQATANEEAVKAAYAERTGNVTEMLNNLGFRLQLHQGRFEDALRAGRTDWGFVGNIGHVAEVLTEITRFLGKV